MSAYAYLAIILAVCAVLYYARKGGQDSIKADVAKNDVKAAERIADAQATGPSNIADVRERLRNGGKL